MSYKAKRTISRRLLLEPVEEQLLYSADALGGLDVVTRVDSDMAVLETSLLTVDSQAANSDFHGRNAINSVDEALSRELIFVDIDTANYQQLVDDLLSDHTSNRHFQLYLLDNNHNGIDQISNVLADYESLDAIHIISHGEDGAIKLGATLLDFESLSERSAAIKAWGAAFNEGGDLLIYGCEVAATSKGQAFIDRISHLTGADVAASVDVTGHESLAGDWDLEYKRGDIDSDIAIASASQQSWEGVLAPGLTPIGSEVLVNGNSTGNQSTTVFGGGNVAMDPNGNYAIAWEDQRSGNLDTYLQIYNSDGSVRVPEFVVHTASIDSQDWPTVAMTDAGNIVVTWSDDRSGDYEVYMRLYDIDGSALTSETLVSTLAGAQDANEVDTAADGSFIIVFQSLLTNDVYMQRYDANGLALGANTIVNSTTVNTQNHPDVAVADDGSSVVTWMSGNQDGSGYGMFAQRFSATGVAVGSEFQVNQTSIDDQQYGTIDGDAAGNFVVTWMSNNQDGSGFGVYARLFNAAGTAQTNEILVNTATAGYQGNPNVSMDDAGAFIVTWHDATGLDGSSLGVYAQQFDRAGNKIGTETPVNTTTISAQENASVAFSGNNAVIVWSGNGTGDTQGVFAQRFNVEGALVSPDLIATTTSEGGLDINTGVGNDIYLQAYESPFTSNTEVTLEVDFSLESAPVGLTTLISYSTPTNQDELYVGIDASGEIFFRTSANGDVGYGSTATALQLFDGERHSVAVTWDNVGGVLMFYVDGQQLGIGRNDYQRTTTIDTGGTLIFGQHQSAPGTAFDIDDVFSGTLYSARLFSDVRSAQEIASNYQSVLPHDEDGLIAQWRFDNLSSDGVVTEYVNRNNLTVFHTNQVGFSSSQESLTFAVAENAINGTLVGAVAGIDPEREARIATLLTANPNLVYSAETGKFYEYVDTGKNWTTALADAQSSTLGGVNGNLVKIGSAVENQIVVDLMNANGASQAYIAASDAIVEGEWRWYDDGSAAELFHRHDGDGYTVNSAYENWDVGNPNNHLDAQHYAKIFASTGLWDDVEGISNQMSIIEYDADAVLDATDALTYSFALETEPGAFAINASTGQITVADASLLDFNADPVHTLSIRYTDVDSNTFDTTILVSLRQVTESNTAPTDLSSGIEINTDGGNDTYLQAGDGGAILGGLTSLTFETSFKVTEVISDNVLASYATGNATGHFQIEIKNYGDLFVRVNGSAGSFTGFNYSELLLDNERHHFALTWDNTNGDIAIYVDGELMESKTGFFTGQTIAGGPGDGTLLFGQDRDTSADNFDPFEGLHGVLYDIRVWDEVRTTAEIALNHQQKIDPAGIPASLIANWQMKGFNGSQEIVDSVSGNNLSIEHASKNLTNWTNQVGGVTANANTLTYIDDGQPDGWSSSINSANVSTLGVTDDYTIKFTLGNTTNFAWTVGLGSIESDATYTDPEYAIFVDHVGGGNSVDIRHNGSIIGSYVINYASDGEFGFYVNGTTLEYQYNGVTFATDTITAGTDWYIDTSFYVRTTDSTYNNQDDYSLSNFHIIDGNSSAQNGFSESTPVEDLHISEHAGTGTVVGVVVPSDSDLNRDLITDGRFLDGDTGLWTNYTIGQTFGGWTVVSGHVSHTSQYPSPLGGVGLELQRVDGDFPSSIAQSLNTEIGRQYQLIFNMTGNFDSGNPTKYVTASIDGQSETFAVTDTADFGNVYESRTLTFTADSAITELKFAAGVDDGWAAVISDVRVIEIPPAVTFILNNDPSLSYDAGTGKFYKVVTTGDTVQGATIAAHNDLLNGVNGQLVTIRSEYENDLVREMADLSTNLFWIGGTDNTSEGIWNWVENGQETDFFFSGGVGGSAPTNVYANFVGEPNGGTSENYSVIRPSDGIWLDVSGLGSSGYIVEWDANEVMSRFTFALADASNNFVIDSSSGEITVAATSTLDYEVDQQHDVDVTVFDASGKTYTETMTIYIDNGVEPTQSVPAAQNVDEDNTLTFSAVNANAITVSDTMPGTDSRLQVFISVNDGVLNLSQTTGLSILGGSNGSTFMTIHGTESDINAAFEGMTFTPDPGFTGSVTLNMTTSLSADMVGHYSFESASVSGTTVIDQSVGLSQNGILNGNAAIVNDIERGDVLDLDGNADFVEITGLMGNPANVTLAAWINADSVDVSGAVVISMGTSPALYLNPDGTLIGYYESGGSINILQTSESLVGEGWTHVAVSIDATNSKMTLFVNGEAVTSLIPVGAIEYDNSPNTFIGRAGDGLPDFDFDGMIDEAKIYSRALTIDEVAALAGEVPPSSDSVAITVEAINEAPTFSLPGESVFTIGSSGYGLNEDSLALSNGSMLITPYDSSGKSVLVRLNADGSIDTSFGVNGFADNSSIGYIQSMAEQSDGKIVVSGILNLDIFIARYNADGTLDTSFGTSGVTVLPASGSDEATDIAIQTDGSIVVVGEYGDDSIIARLTNMGNLDGSFGTGGIVTVNLGGSAENLESVGVLSTGDIIAVGVNSVVKMDSNGVLDSGFDSDGILNLGVIVESVFVQTDDKFVVTGGDGTNLFLIRFNADGSIDTSFGASGTATWSMSAATGHAVVQQSDGKLIVAGHTDNYPTQWVAVRFLSNGSLDTSFGNGGAWVMETGTDFSEAHSVSLYTEGADEKIVIGGYTTRDGFGNGTFSTMIRLNSDGSFDNSLSTNTLDGNPTFIEGGAAVVLDNDVQIHDSELSKIDNFAGATLTLERATAANSFDVFSATGLLGALTEAGNLDFNGITIGTVTTNSGGTLLLTFNSNADNDAVNGVMQSIAYENSSDAPPTNVQIDWTFSDGGDSVITQGSPGVGLALGSTVVTITPIDDPAVISGDISYSGNEGDAVAGAMSATDAEGLTDGTIFSVTSAATNGTAVIDPATGAWTFTPTDAHWFGSDNFTVTVTDDLDGITTQVVNITLANLDDPAIISGDISYAGNEGDVVAGTMSATDVEGLTDGTIFSITSAATNGTAVIDPATGAWTFTPTDADWFGSDNFTVTVTDDLGGITTQVVNITLTNLDDPAIISGDISYNGNEGDAVAGTLNATDVEGLTDGTIFSITSAATNGSATIDPATGAWTFAPTDANWFGTDSFTVTVTDDLGGTTTQMVNITLVNQDDPAVISGGINYVGNEGDVVTGTMSATDVEGLTDGTIFSVTSAATNGSATIDPATGAWTFAPTDANWFGTDSFTVTVTDDLGGTTTQMVNITLVNQDDPAVISGDISYVGNEGDVVAGTMSATDVEGLTDGTVFTVTSAATNGTAAIDPATGAWTFTSTNANWFGTDNFTVTVTDDLGGITTQVVNITLANRDDPAIISGDISYNGNEGDAVAGTLNATDVEGLTDGTIFSVTSVATNGTAVIDPAIGTWTFTPTDADWFGTDIFTVTVTDDLGGTTTQVVSITLANRDDLAVITGDISFTGNEEDMVAGTITATDVDGLIDGTIFTVTSAATNGTAVINPASGAWTFTPTDTNWFGSDSFIITVNDDLGGTTTQVVNITLTNRDDPAVITGDINYTGNEADVVAGTINASDVEGLTDGTIFSVTSAATNGTAVIDPATGTWTFTPNDADWFGTDIFTVTVTDDLGGTTTQVVNITLANRDDLAVITGDINYTGNEGDVVAGTINASDVEGLTDGTIFSVTSAATNGTAVINPATGTWTFTPTDADWFGTDIFTVTVTDDLGGTTTQVVSITLANQDDPTIISGDISYTGNEGDVVAGTINASDVDGLTDGTVFSVTSAATNGTVAIDPASGAWTYTPTDANWFGNDNFTVTVTDDLGGTTTQLVNVTLSNINDPTVVTGDISFSGNNGDSITGIVSAFDIDGLTNTAIYSISEMPTEGTATIDPVTGAWFYIPGNENWFGSDSFEITIRDDLGGISTQIVDVQIVERPSLGAANPEESTPPDELQPVSAAEISNGHEPITASELEFLQAVIAVANSQTAITPASASTADIISEAISEGITDIQVPEIDDEQATQVDSTPRKTPRYVAAESPQPIEDLLTLQSLLGPVTVVNLEEQDAVDNKIPTIQTNLRRATQSMRDQMNEAADDERLPERAADMAFRVTGATLSAGSLAWLLRGGSLFASALSAIPTWQGFDPLPVLMKKRDSRLARNYRPSGKEPNLDTQERDAGQILDSIQQRDRTGPSRNQRELR